MFLNEAIVYNNQARAEVNDMQKGEDKEFAIALRKMSMGQGRLYRRKGD